MANTNKARPLFICKVIGIIVIGNGFERLIPHDEHKKG